MLPKIECSDELLLGILNQDLGCSSELGLQHFDECEHCQTRIEELAANEQQWTLAREGLCSRGNGGLDIENEFVSPTRFVPAAEYSSDWTDTMAKQLLQPPSHPEMLGRLGRYEIERLVGSGGMGVVFKAYDSELHRSVAIKMLAPHLSGSRSARERFAREARAAAAIVNDHVVPIHNVETEHATPYLVMQYIAGDSLQARLDRDGPLDVCEILRIGMQVATGLAAAHAQGLIHRDVKPSNIMLDENVARALLTDFGLARTQDEACLTRSGFHPGTPHYMSPEQVRGEELDGRSDLFSLGCVLYALCTGHPPYRADSGYAVMRRITDEQPRSIREQNALIPEWLERVVMRLLEKDRESRFQSAEELAQILEQCLAHTQKPATEPLPLAVVPKASFFDRGRIRDWILAGMASAFLFFAGVFIVLETNKGTITIKSEADNVPIRIKRSDQVVDEMVVSRTGKSVRLAAGEYVIEFDGDSQDLVVEGGNVSLVRGDTQTLQIAYRKSGGAETRMSADRSESKIDKSDVYAPSQSVSLVSAIDAFNRGHSAELLAANSPLLTEDELCAALWWHANHVDFSPAPRQSLLEIVLTGRLLPGWSIQLRKIQWDAGKLWRDKPSTSRAIEINLVNKEQYVAPIRFQFASSGLESNVPANSPLADAIAEFNKNEAGDQPPLTLPETLAALSTLWLNEPNRTPETAKLTEDAVTILKQIADQQTMDGHTIESSLREHEVGDSKFLTWTTKLRVKINDGFLGTESFQIRKRFIRVDSVRISARRSQAAALHTYEKPANVSDFTKPKAWTSEGAADLASAVDDFNRAHTVMMRSANTPPLTEDELVAGLWWQYRQPDFTEELKEVAREVALTRTLPKGWSLGLRLTKWGNDKFWETPEQTKSIEIELQRGAGNLIRIRSQYVASRLITSWNYRPESPLRSAIAKFNSQYTTTEPAITCDEVVAAISTLMENSPSELARSHGLTEESIHALRRIAMMHEMGDFAFERIQSDELDDGGKFSVWSVRLTAPKSGHDGKTQAFEIRKRFLKVESDEITARMKESTAPHTEKTPTPLLDFSKVIIPAFESDLTAAIEEFNHLNSEMLRATSSPPLTEDELVASLWWQYSQSKLREEISETIKEIVVTRKLPLGWSIKLNTREWAGVQQWWHDKPLSSSAIQINLFGKEGLATTIRNRFVSSDISSIRPPESALQKAIEEFNKSHSEEAPELTLDETLSALSTLWVKQSWYSYDGLKPSTMDALMAAIDRHEMKGVKIKLLHSYQTAEEDRFDVCSIRLEVESDQDGSTQAFTIRERFQKVNSFSDETIHWGKPSDEGLQAGFRLKPAQAKYLSGQVVDVEFFYRSIHGKGLTATIPNVFHFNRIEIDVLGGDGNQRLTVEDDAPKIIAGWRREGIGEQPTMFKNRKIRFVDSPEQLAAAKQVPDDWTTNVMLPINTRCDITFDVPDFADTTKSGSLLTGITQVTILNGIENKRPFGIAPDASAIPREKHGSFLQSALDSVKQNFDEGLATQEDVWSAELELLEARIAGTKDIKSLPSLLKQREDIVQRAFLAAKAKYEAGLIGIDPFSVVVAANVDARFAARIAAEGNQSSVFKSLEILAKSENIPTERIRAEADRIAQQIENELGREGLWRTLELVVYVDLRERKTNAVGRVNGNPLQPLIQLDGDLSELLDSTLPMQLRELGIELAQPQGPKWIQVGYSCSIQSSQSFTLQLTQLHETRQRGQTIGIDEAFLQAVELPNELSHLTGAGLFAFLKEAKGIPALLSFSRDLSVSSVQESLEQNLGFASIEMLNDSFGAWIEEKHVPLERLTTWEEVEAHVASIVKERQKILNADVDFNLEHGGAYASRRRYHVWLNDRNRRADCRGVSSDRTQDYSTIVTPTFDWFEDRLDKSNSQFNNRNPKDPVGWGTLGCIVDVRKVGLVNWSIESMQFHDLDEDLLPKDRIETQVETGNHEGAPITIVKIKRKTDKSVDFWTEYWLSPAHGNCPIYIASGWTAIESPEEKFLVTQHAQWKLIDGTWFPTSVKHRYQCETKKVDNTSHFELISARLNQQPFPNVFDPNEDTEW